MASNFAKIALGQNFKPQPTTNIASPANGDLYYDSTRNTFTEYNNGNWSDNQSRTDVASASSMTASGSFPANVVQSSLVRITGSTAGTVTGLTAQSDAKYLILYNESTALITIANQSPSEATAANRIICPNGASLSVSSGQSVLLAYDSSQARWVVLTSTGSGGSGSGAGKNYLAQYIASTSGGTQNTGNGNFELGSTSGFTLAHSALSNLQPSSTASPGTAFSATSGGSAANANLSVGVVSSGQLSGSYSANLASSTASTAGDMFISNAFYIDLEDEAKIMTVKAYYKVITNNGLNFSGTSANSFAVWIYDVTNGAWIMPAGVYGMTQNSGSGYVTATFQTTSNSSQYQLAIVNINASSGAYSLYLDDLSVGPQTAPIGPVETDWTSYTPTISGFGTCTNINFSWSRKGDTLLVRGYFTGGTSPGAVLGTFTLPGGYTIDTNKITINNTTSGSGESVGWILPGSNGSQISPLVTATGTNAALIYIGAQPGSASNTTPTNVGSVISNGQNITMRFAVPIAGWSSNVQMSSDTDTRVVQATYFASVNQSPAANVQINYDTKVTDTHAAVTTGAGTWKFTAPVTGYYAVSIVQNLSSGTCNMKLYKNGSAVQYLVLASTSITPGTTEVFLNAGDFIDIRDDGGNTIIGAAAPYETMISIHRLSGPAVVAATESVNGRYYSSTSSVTSSYGTVTYATKDFDTHNAYSGGTLTLPVSGKFQINAGIQMGGTFNANTAVKLAIFQNGSQKSEAWQIAGDANGATNLGANISDIIKGNAGDTIVIQALTNGTGVTIDSSNFSNYFSWSRVGN